MIQYQYPENPPLFTDSPREINWNRVAKADAIAAGTTLISGLISRGIIYIMGGLISWSELALEIGVHAAMTSAAVFFKESTSCTIERANPNHSYFYESGNSIYYFMENNYYLYGTDYFINKWDGRFYFMTSNF